MNQFKSPEEAINACNEGCEEAWTEFSKPLPITETNDPKSYKAIKSIFAAGYAAGAKWVTEAVVYRMMAAGAVKLPISTSKS